ncbi:hypothetical protein ACFL1H_05230 [Nanoarchaeota archaeon]
MVLKCAIFCPESLDGVASAAVLVRMARLKNYNYRITFVSYQNANAVFEDMSKLENTAIFILDFSPEEIKDLEKKIKKLQKYQNKIVYWNSHLPFTKQTKEMLTQHVKIVDFAGVPIEEMDSNYNKNSFCSAELSTKRFMPTDFVSLTLAKIARDKEFWERQDERSMKLTDVLNSGFNKRELIEMLSKGVYWGEQFEEIRNEYIAKREKALEDLTTKMIIKNYITKKVGISLASTLLSSSDAGERMIDTGAIEIAAILFKDGKLSFRRSNDSKINLAKVASKFEGGGNQYASAGKILLNELHLDRIGSQKDFEKVVNHVHNVLIDFFGA